MTTKTINPYVVIDWKSGQTRTRKSEPSASDLGANEVIAKLDIEIEIPEVDIPTLSMTVDVPEPQVHAATLEAIDEEDLPDWTDMAAEVVDERAEQVAGSMDDPDPRAVAEHLTTQVMIDAPGRPNPEHVRDYLHDILDGMVGPYGDLDVE